MKRNNILKIINPLLAVLIINQILTGLFGHALSCKAFEILHKGGGYTLASVAALACYRRRPVRCTVTR